MTKFVTPGFALTNIKEGVPMRVAKKVGVKQQIMTSPSGSYYSLS